MDMRGRPRPIFLDVQARKKRVKSPKPPAGVAFWPPELGRPGFDFAIDLIFGSKDGSQ